MPILVILFICLWGWLELTVFIAIGEEIGIALTLIGVAVTGVVGIWLLKSQGRLLMRSVQEQMAQGKTPVASVADGASILFGAVLMLIPGYVTDAIGLAFFVPGLRTLLGAYLLARLARGGGSRFGFKTAAPDFNSKEFSDSFNRSFEERRASQDDDIIEGDFEEKPADHDRIDRK